ncbi:MAG: polymer-forming cytoskeletal protein [Anaerolineae bacterium]|nr:polymer-forming cytoskeletal protein [Anaerolineae bacterium]
MSFFGGRRQQEDSESKSATPSKPAAPPPRQPIGFETVLGSGTRISGDFTGSGNARFDGVLEGSLEIDGNILIGETAKITADIHARNISIAGAVRGNVHGNKVQILRTGRVWGDIHATAITTEEGAFIDGKISMVGHEATVERLEVSVTPPLPEPAITLEEPDFMAAVDAEREREAAATGAAEEEETPTLILGEAEAEAVEEPAEEQEDRREDLPVDDEGAVG